VLLGKRDNSNQITGKSRQRILVGFVVVFLSILVIRLFSLQSIHHDEYARFAEKNQLQRERIIAPRGYFTDNAGRILADNVLRFQIVLPWKKEGEVAATVSKLAAYFSVDSIRVLDRFASWKKKNGRAPFPVVTDADKIMISFVRENADLFPSLRVNSRARRRYRQNEITAHVLGYVGEVREADLLRGGENRYHPGDMVGKTSLELYCEEFLRGRDGQRVLEVNVSGTPLGEVTDLSIPPEVGTTVTLTLESRMQAHLEGLVSGKGSGAAVAMNVHDGSLIAAVSVPRFDPNEFTSGISQERLDALLNEETKPLFNRIHQARYPPASTLKIVSTFAILTNRIVDPNEILVYCAGAHFFGDRVYRCWQAEGHGAMNLYNAFVHSCDTYYYKVAEIMDVDVLASASTAFGLGEKTGIELPGEVPGLIPSRGYYDRKLGKGKWTQGYILNNIIGQGEYLTNVLHVVRICAAVANGGYLVQPHIIQKVGNGPPVAYAKRSVPRLSGATLRFLRSAMKGVVENDGGTANWTRIEGFKSAGKTGTAQNPHGKPHAWYTAYAPADNPEIAIVVLIENAGHGSEVAAPIVRDFFLEYFDLRESGENESELQEARGTNGAAKQQHSNGAGNPVGGTR
jgi:penicillin-binding protein 2